MTIFSTFGHWEPSQSPVRNLQGPSSTPEAIFESSWVNLKFFTKLKKRYTDTQMLPKLNIGLLNIHGSTISNQLVKECSKNSALKNQ